MTGGRWQTSTICQRSSMPGMGSHPLEPLVAADGLVGPDLVEPLPLGAPAALAELELGGGVAGSGLGQVVERGGVEVDADQGEQAAGLAVAGPEDLVVPVRLLPADSLGRVDLGQRAQEPRLEPLALPAEQLAGAIDVQLLGELAHGAPYDDPGDDQAGGQDHHPDQQPHDYTLRG